MTRFRKWIENYWYHYKGATFLGIFVAIVLIVGVSQCATKDKYDYVVMLGFKRYASDAVLETVSDYFEQYGKDINSDGKVSVQVIDVSTYTGQDEGTKQACSQIMQAEALRGEIMMYVVDQVFYDILNNNLVLFDTCEYFPDKEDTAYNFKQGELAKRINEATQSEYISTDAFITKRTTSRTEKSFMENERNADELLKNMMQDIKTNG